MAHSLFIWYLLPTVSCSKPLLKLIWFSHTPLVIQCVVNLIFADEAYEMTHPEPGAIETRSFGCRVALAMPQSHRSGVPMMTMPAHSEHCKLETGIRNLYQCS